MFSLCAVQRHRTTRQLVRITFHRQRIPQQAVLAIAHRQCLRIHHIHQPARPTRTVQPAHKNHAVVLSICYLNFIVISRQTESNKNTLQMQHPGHLKQCMVSSIQERANIGYQMTFFTITLSFLHPVYEWKQTNKKYRYKLHFSLNAIYF